MRQQIKTYRYELIAAVAGGVVMVLELVGARMVAPYFGTSLYVWTAMIGVILGALSLGYWYGGKLADQSPSDIKLMKIIVLAALGILAALLVQEPLLGFTAQTIDDIRLASLLAALSLFAPASLLLGMVSPYVARLRLDSLQNAGQSIGRLYAAGTLGSIGGTFLAGYWLIALFGNRTLGFGLVLVLLGLSFFTYPRGFMWRRLAILLAALAGIASTTAISSNIIADIDSAYSRYLVTETNEIPPERSLITDPFSVQSVQRVGQPDLLVAEYTQQFMNIMKAHTSSSILVVGGGVYTFPVAAARAYPRVQVTAVEIDPKLTSIAKKYFGLQPYHNLTIVHADGRVFLNQVTPGRYDLIFMDAFSSLTPPYQLTTVEAIRREQIALKAGGAVVANLVAYGENDPYLAAITSTYRAVFENVAVYQAAASLPLSARQNLLIVATDDKTSSAAISKQFGSQHVAVPSAQDLTDDYAPVEQLINQR